ncbi:probable 20S rRNA accumulation protein 4 isoform X1 [Coffea arabica]|uniref:Probable 20S rRNA accumulation protein 4 isoform X1 n=1 Tax=Coffea arabica TaxID=13443 RepID=A0ABM4V7F9_COFAR
MEEVILGMPGPWADDNYEVADHYTTKIGGLPDWPIPDIGIKPELLICPSCKSNLCLLAQVYAPISSESLTLEERVIYIFGCVMLQCGSNPSSWRALRVQKSVSSEDPFVHSNDVAPFPSSSVSAVKNDWQQDLWTFESREDDDGGNGDDLDLEDLSRAFSEAASLSSNSKKQSCDPEASLKPSSTDEKSKANDKRFPVLPCFYIYAQEEKFTKEVTSLWSKYGSLSVNGNESDLDDHTPEERWEEEKYEYDKALNADRTYLKFKKRIDAYPEQCFRYSYGGRPLVAFMDKEGAGTCCLCGGSRQYEMQLMPPLLYFLQKATSKQPNISLESWNWMTLIIYTCSKSCAESIHLDKPNNHGWVVAEEAVVVQLE